MSTTPTDSDNYLLQWREQMLNRVLFVMILFCSIAVLIGMWDAWQNFREIFWQLTIGYSLCYLILIMLGFWRGLGYQIRSSGLVILLLVTGGFVMTTDGLSGEGRSFLLIAALMAALLFPLNVVIVVIIAAMLIFIALAWLFLTGALSAPDTILANVAIWQSWGSMITVQLALGLLAIVSLNFLVLKLEEVGVAAEQHAQRAQQAAHQTIEQTHTLAAQQHRLSQTEQQLDALVASLDAPLVELADHVMLAPLIGALDQQRSDRILRHMLHQIQQRRTKLLILDIAALGAIESTDIQQLAEMISATQLLGCRTALTGVKPEAALLLASQTFDLPALWIVASPQAALERWRAGVP